MGQTLETGSTLTYHVVSPNGRQVATFDDLVVMDRWLGERKGNGIDYRTFLVVRTAIEVCFR